MKILCYNIVTARFQRLHNRARYRSMNNATKTVSDRIMYILKHELILVKYTVNYYDHRSYPGIHRHTRIHSLGDTSIQICARETQRLRQ